MTKIEGSKDDDHCKDTLKRFVDASRTDFSHLYLLEPPNPYFKFDETKVLSIIMFY